MTKRKPTSSRTRHARRPKRDDAFRAFLAAHKAACREQYRADLAELAAYAAQLAEAYLNDDMEAASTVRYVGHA